MHTFLDDDFLLHSKCARRLYHEHAAQLPVLDFHTHLSPETFVRNSPPRDIVELWIAADPYKWRAMRMNGVPEALITGGGDPWPCFDAWAATVPRLAGNPLYHWTHMELRTFFGVETPLAPETARRIFDRCNEVLQGETARPQQFLRSSRVAAFCSSDAWLDSLEPHRIAVEQGIDPRMLPSLRADDAFVWEQSGFTQWLGRLQDATGIAVRALGDFLAALAARLDHFESAGCTIADHGIDDLRFACVTELEAEAIFARLLAGERLAADARENLQTFLLLWLGEQYGKRQWTLQLHIGAQRATSSRLAARVGKAGGYACIGSSIQIETLVRLLDAFERTGAMPRIVIYPLNPSDFEMAASVCGSFVEDGVPGKVQLGAAWWYNDHRDGIMRQLRATASYGLLGRFVGMVTDSRSFLSGVRHQYFRRLLCDLVGTWVEEGELPEDETELRELLEAICCTNARQQLRLGSDSLSNPEHSHA